MHQEHKVEEMKQTFFFVSILICKTKKSQNKYFFERKPKAYIRKLLIFVIINIQKLSF